MHKYENRTHDQLEELFSNFLIDSWSYSKISSFARHEKEFEMTYVYGYKQKRSASSVSGNAYHKALETYFDRLKDGEILDLASLEIIACDYIQEIHPNTWKLQKTTPTIDECIQKSMKTAVQLVRNFYNEKSVYEHDIEEILFVELYCTEFVTINGVDIPLPCHAMIDLGVRTKSGKIAVIDHKSKSVFSDEKEMALSIGKQAITYVSVFEKNSGLTVDEVWFVENKYSMNRDKSKQLNCFKIVITPDTRKLYEALLYEPLKRMIEAVSNPDYVYLINENDSFTDIAEIHTFWAKTMIAEVDEFNVPESKRELIKRRLKKIRDASIASINPTVIKKFKENADEFIQYDLSDKNMTQEEKIQHVLRSFGIIVNVAHTIDGYSSNTYLLEVASGVKIQSIHTHKLDIANVLDVPSVRIMQQLKVYNGKSYVCLEISKKRDKDLFFDAKIVQGMKIPIGMDNYNQQVVWDLQNHSTPHALVCGATGSGKSVSINSTIAYMIECGIKNIHIMDPKFEFTKLHNGSSILVYNDILDIENAMIGLVDKMNNLVKSGSMEYTAIIFDEFADALSASRQGNELNIYENLVIGMFKDGREKVKRECVGKLKSLDENLRILLQKGRSSGFRILAATQRASVKVINGDTKVNFPVQICFRVPKDVDSKVVLDEGGAESLAGMGDGLMRSPEYDDIVRFQAFYKP